MISLSLSPSIEHDEFISNFIIFLRAKIVRARNIDSIDAESNFNTSDERNACTLGDQMSESKMPNIGYRSLVHLSNLNHFYYLKQIINIICLKQLITLNYTLGTKIKITLVVPGLECTFGHKFVFISSKIHCSHSKLMEQS